MRILLAFLVAASLYGQQSVAIGTPTNTGVTARTSTASTRIDFYLHDWGAYSDGLRAFEATFAGCIGLYSGSNLRILKNIDGGDVFDIPLGPFVNKRMYGRIERDHAALVWRVEAWDETGARLFNLTRSFVQSGSTSNGAFVNASANAGAMGFFRVHSTLVGANARPPVTNDNANRLLEWKYEGSLADSSGNGWTATGSVTYTSTPGITLVVSVPKVNATAWSNQTSMRAGFPATLDGTSSYSQAPGSSAVTCAWTQVSGRTKVIIENAGQCTATVRGLIFGDYTLQLKVTDTDNNTALSTIAVGSVATDINGVVIHANPAADDIFGPMIAFGRNPWGYADDAALRGSNLRAATYTNFGVGIPNWQRSNLGTVTYKVGETHLATLTSSITSTALDIPVSTLTGFDLTYPTVITLGNVAGSGEEVKICGNTGNTLHACFDGRGYNAANRRQDAFSSGDRVYQRVANGTSTSFLSLYCPDGVGLEGSVTTTTGTVSPSLGGFSITGNSTGWTNNSLGGHTIHIVGTHSSGTPFDYYANITANTPTSLTVDKAYPSMADAPPSTMSYSIVLLGRKSFVPRFTRSVGGEGYAEFGVTHCASNSKIYFNGGFDVYTGTHTDKAFGYMETTAKWLTNAGNGSINYYGEDLANYALWLRSGLASARDAARYVADNWLKIPDLNEWAFGSSLVPQGRNAAMTGAFARTMLDTDGVTRLDEWAALRKAGQYAVTIPTKYAGDCGGGGDQRNIAYPVMWVGMLAKNDPATTGTAAPGGIPWRTYWQNQLGTLYTFLNSCNINGGFESSFANGIAVSATANQTAITGSGFTSGMCGVATGSGTATATNGSGTITILSGTVPSGNLKIILFGTRSGAYYSVQLQYSGTGPVLLSGQWAGDSGTINWRTENNESQYLIADAAVMTSSTPAYLIGCTYNSPTSITLAANYPGTTGTKYMSVSNVTGFGQQPFFGGIWTLAANYATLGATGGTATNFQSMLTGLGTWIKDNGYDPVNSGLYYANVKPSCFPIVAEANASLFYMRNIPCNFNSSTAGKQSARALLAEAQTSFRTIYEASPTTPNRDIGDLSYAGLYGQSYCSASQCGDGVTNEFTNNISLNLGKWYGFQFGIGMAHQWPAVRIGGVAAADIKQVKFSFTAESGTVSTSIEVRAPSGAESTVACSSGTGLKSCDIPVDFRMGNPVARMVHTMSVGTRTGDWQELRAQ